MGEPLREEENSQESRETWDLSAVSDGTPLADLLASRLNSPEVKRMQKLTSILSAFHLKGLTIDPPRNGSSRDFVQGEKVSINFSSGNYLGLDRHPEVIEACVQGARKWSGHSGSSRIFYSQRNTLELESEIASLVGAESSLLAVNVSQVHQGVIPVLFANSQTSIFIDKHAHTSMYMASLIAKAKGARLCRVDLRRSLVEAFEKMASDKSPHKVLLVDGLFSMQGDIPPLIEVQSLCEQHKVVLYVDDAHGIGILGDHGGGVAEHFNLNFGNMILVGSLQKGLACSGGFVAASKKLIDLLKVQSTSYIFSGPLQPHTIESIRAAIRVCRSSEGKSLRGDLRKKSKRIRQELISLGYQIQVSESPIIPIPIGDDASTLYAGRLLYDLGFYVSSVCFPAVPKGEGILRVTVNSCHKSEEIDHLLEAFVELQKWLCKESWKQKVDIAREVLLSNIRGDEYAGVVKKVESKLAN